MRSSRLRLSQARTLQILDSETRARYKNVRESAQLRLKLELLQVRHLDALSQLANERYEIRTKLHELRYEIEQRELLKRFTPIVRQTSTSSAFKSNSREGRDSGALKSPDLRLEEFGSSMKWGDDIDTPPSNARTHKAPLDAFNSRRLQSAAAQPRASIVRDTVSLEKHVERIQSANQLAAPRTKRRAQTAVRRENHVR